MLNSALKYNIIKYLLVIFCFFNEQRIRRPSKLKKMFKELAWHLLFQVIAIAHLIKNFLLELILGWYLGERKTCPALKGDTFLTKSAIDLAQMIRKRELTSTKLVQACINRIHDVSSVFGLLFLLI